MSETHLTKKDIAALMIGFLLLGFILGVAFWGFFGEK